MALWHTCRVRATSTMTSRSMVHGAPLWAGTDGASKSARRSASGTQRAALAPASCCGPEPCLCGCWWWRSRGGGGCIRCCWA